MQRLPSLLGEVHRAIEERSLRFALTGSSTRKLRRAGVNLLAGRAVHRAMHPFAPEEIGRGFDLERALRFGTLPLIWMAQDPEDTRFAYARLYLKEEIHAEASFAAECERPVVGQPEDEGSRPWWQAWTGRSRRTLRRRSSAGRGMPRRRPDARGSRLLAATGLGRWMP